MCQMSMKLPAMFDQNPSHTFDEIVKNLITTNKAYRPNAHLLNIFMQLKYQFAVRTRFRISIKWLLVVPCIILCAIS